jgi:hypothetical protein
MYMMSHLLQIIYLFILEQSYNGEKEKLGRCEQVQTRCMNI